MKLKKFLGNFLKYFVVFKPPSFPLPTRFYIYNTLPLFHISHYRRVLVLEMALHGDQSTEAGTAMSNLATILEELGDFEHAEELFSKVLEIKTEKGQPNEVASAHCLLAGALKNNGKMLLAESHYREAIELLKKTYGEKHESIGILNQTLSIFPKLNKLKAVEFKVNTFNEEKEEEEYVMKRANPSWSSIITSTLELEVAVVEPMTAHVDLLNPSELKGKAALVIRGESSFSEKVSRCQEAGALLVIVMSSDEKHPNAVFQMGAPEGYQSELPAFMVSYNNGEILKKLHLNGKSSVKLVPPS